MQTALGIIVAILVLTFLVVIHEASHALVARLCGMRVTELFVGLPYGPQASFQSKKSGIRYGATLALLGGYTRISGMAYRDDPRLALALAVLNARGRLSVDELAQVLDCDSEQAGILLDMLADIGSAQPCQNKRGRSRAGEAQVFVTPARDEQGRTIYDRGHRFDTTGFHAAGAPYISDRTPEELLAFDVAHTYAGKGFWKRAAVLVAGITANIVFAIIIVAAFYMVQGVQYVPDTIASVQEGSIAQQAGIETGDRIVSVAGQDVTNDYDALSSALSAQRSSGQTFELVWDHNGEQESAEVTLAGDDAVLGITYSYETIHLSLGQALYASLTYTVLTAQAIVELLIPSQTMQVLDQSAGIIGIVAITGQAAQSGVWDVLALAAALSLSLGWLNLLPIPPLDGGKLLIEVIQAVIRRPVPMAVQSGLSMIGMSLILLLFVFMIYMDITRVMTGVY